jgi:hypothetical protein
MDEHTFNVPGRPLLYNEGAKLKKRIIKVKSKLEKMNAKG